ncbi:MAG: hypothetical protein ACE5IB_08355, partial [Candidatus Geothermarchaeales archaeon]
GYLPDRVIVVGYEVDDTMSEFAKRIRIEVQVGERLFLSDHGLSRIEGITLYVLPPNFHLRSTVSVLLLEMAAYRESRNSAPRQDAA